MFWLSVYTKVSGIVNSCSSSKRGTEANFIACEKEAGEKKVVLPHKHTPMRCWDQHAVAIVANCVEQLVDAGAGASGDGDMRRLYWDRGPEVGVEERGKNGEEGRSATETARIRKSLKMRR